MKLSNLTAKLTCMKSKAVRILAAGMLAGAVLTVAAPAAKAQQFGFSVQYGPRYYAPAPRAYGYGYYPGYWERHRAEEIRREEFIRHQEWLRHHNGYGNGYYGHGNGYGNYGYYGHDRRY